MTATVVTTARDAWPHITALRTDDGTVPYCERCGWRGQLGHLDGVAAMMAGRREHGAVECVSTAGSQQTLI